MEILQVHWSSCHPNYFGYFHRWVWSSLVSEERYLYLPPLFLDSENLILFAAVTSEDRLILSGTEVGIPLSSVLVGSEGFEKSSLSGSRSTLCSDLLRSSNPFRSVCIVLFMWSCSGSDIPGFRDFSSIAESRFSKVLNLFRYFSLSDFCDILICLGCLITFCLKVSLVFWVLVPILVRLCRLRVRLAGLEMAT